MAYTPPDNDAIALQFKGSYSAPDNDDINLEFNKGSADISPDSIESGETFGGVTFSDFTIVPESITSEESVSSADFEQELKPDSILSDEAFGSASVAVVLSVSSILTEEEFGPLSCSNLSGVFPGSIGSEEAFGSVEVNDRVSPVAISSEEAFGALDFTGGALAPGSIDSEEAFGATGVAVPVGGLVSITSEEAFGSLSVTQQLAVPSIDSEESFEAPYVHEIARGIQRSLNPVSATTSISTLYSGAGLTTYQLGLNEFCDSISGVQVDKVSLLKGDPFTGLQSAPASFVVKSIQNLSLEIYSNVQGISAVPGSLSGDPVTGLQSYPGILNDTDHIQGIQHLSLSMDDLETQFLSTGYSVTIDGSAVDAGSIRNLTITINQSSVHNSISFSSSDMQLFYNCNPAVNSRTTRITVTVGSRFFSFLIEDRNGSEWDFTVWGRAISALADDPYAEEISVRLTAQQSAAATALAMLPPGVTLNWSLPDWQLPVGFSFVGLPMAGITKLASHIGGVVRCQDDGTLLARRKYLTRPIDLPAAASDIDYDRYSNLIELSVDEQVGNYCNLLNVFGYSGDVQVPDLSLEESCVVQGDTFHVRAYWSNGTLPTTPPDVYLTDGNYTDEFTQEEEVIEEVVEFKDGAATTTKPVTRFDQTDVGWIGADGGVVTWAPYTKELTIPNEAFRLATIRYISTYRRYAVHGHNVSALMQVLTLPPSVNIAVQLVQFPGDKQAPDLKLSLLTTEAIAVEAGTAWLDDNKYTKYVITASAPYSDNAVDGAICQVDDGIIFLSGNFYIEEATIVIDGPRITNNLRLVQCQT